MELKKNISNYEVFKHFKKKKKNELKLNANRESYIRIKINTNHLVRFKNIPENKISVYCVFSENITDIFK